MQEILKSFIMHLIYESCTLYHHYTESLLFRLRKFGKLATNFFLYIKDKDNFTTIMTKKNIHTHIIICKHTRINYQNKKSFHFISHTCLVINIRVRSDDIIYHCDVWCNGGAGLSNTEKRLMRKTPEKIGTN